MMNVSGSLQLSSEERDVLQAIASHGSQANAARQTAMDVQAVQLVINRLQDRWRTRSVVDTIVFAYRAGLIR